MGNQRRLAVSLVLAFLGMVTFLGTVQADTTTTPTYSGTVIDGTTKMGLDDVIVVATCMKGKKVIGIGHTHTGKDGTFKLQPEEKHISKCTSPVTLTFTKAKYLEETKSEPNNMDDLNIKVTLNLATEHGPRPVPSPTPAPSPPTVTYYYYYPQYGCYYPQYGCYYPQYYYVPCWSGCCGCRCR